MYLYNSFLPCVCIVLVISCTLGDGCVCTAFASSISCDPILLQFIVIMFSISISGMPNSACPFPGTTKKLQVFYLLLCSIFTFHMPNCVIVVLLCVLAVYLYFLLPPVCCPKKYLFIRVMALCLHHYLLPSSYGTVNTTLMLLLDLLLLWNVCY